MPEPEVWRYLDFESAAQAIDEARVTASEIGRPDRAPPVALEDCDRGIIESALGAPRAGFTDYERYPGFAWKAAALLYSLAKSQACIDGNKRVALILVVTFIDLNGAEMTASNDDVEARIREAAESGPNDRLAVKVRLAEWFAGAIRMQV